MANSEALLDEIQAINAIYEPSTLTLEPDGCTLLLAIPDDGTILSLQVPFDYPVGAASLSGVRSTPAGSPKGHGTAILALATKALAEIGSTGQEVMHELILHLGELLSSHDLTTGQSSSSQHDAMGHQAVTEPEDVLSPLVPSGGFLGAIPAWTFSQPVTEKKSQFVARVCRVDSKEQVMGILSGLLASDKRLAKAAHNISAYRILISSPASATGPTAGSSKRVIADCDDDGESAAGGRLAHLLQLMKVGNLLVVVSRWYGGIKLGPDRFRIINQVAREAIVAGGWTKGGWWEADVGQ